MLFLIFKTWSTFKLSDFYYKKNDSNLLVLVLQLEYIKTTDL